MDISMTETDASRPTPLYEGSPQFRPPSSRVAIIALTTALVVLAAFLWYVFRAYLGSPILAILYGLVFGGSHWIAIGQAKRTRYRIYRDKLEWESPAMGRKDRIVVPVEDVLWVGPRPRDRTDRRAHQKRWSLTPGRIKLSPMHARPNTEAWRVVYTGKIVNHAVDFWPDESLVAHLLEVVPSDRVAVETDP